MWYKIVCPLCNGTGYSDEKPICPFCNSIDITCPHCMRSNDIEYVDCPLCEGEGNFIVDDKDLDTLLEEFGEIEILEENI